mmetsp:Transcript_46587/g.64752  ORF Transcript_46587/g.64752 Transcript_46587/m.64752 type:complete len:463 (+) Transcript_46587:105-1493(+)
MTNMKVVVGVLCALASAGSCHGAAPVRPGQWEALRGALKAWTDISFDANYAVTVGDATGNLFTYVSPGFSMTTRVEGASLSKWPSAVMISGLVADGILSYDDYAHKYLPYWATEEQDPRSRVTLRSLLSFTSGLLEDGYTACFERYEICARKLYEDLPRKAWTEPRTEFQYLSGHLQFAGAMAVAASNKTIEELFDHYLYKKFNMTNTTYGPIPWNPSMAGGITSTGQDFESMLHSLLTYQGLPKEVCEQMETDWTKAPVDPSGDGWFGHYGFGHWWECLGYGDAGERTPLPPLCTDAHIQAGPGEFGFYPLLDRSGGGGAAGPTRQPYYMAVVLAEPDSLSGIPEYLRIVVKPIVDIILSGGDATTTPREQILKAGGGLLLRDVTYIEGELERCQCSGGQQGDPYASLNQGEREDRKGVSRYTLMEEGEGHTLFEVAELQKKIGVCNCEGRRRSDPKQHHV